MQHNILPNNGYGDVRAIDCIARHLLRHLSTEMIIKLKNKYKMALDKMVEEAKKKGGIPDRIEIDQNEAWGILNELQALGRGYAEKSKFALTHLNPQSQHARFIVFGSSRITHDVAKDWVNKWTADEYQITFDNIPLVVLWKADKIPSKPNVPEPKGPIDNG